MFNLITKENFQKMLHTLILNKNDMILLGNLLIMDTITKEEQEKLMYLLYYEYISLNQLKTNNIISLLQNSSLLEKINTQYGHARDYFIRDLITTLSYKNYNHVDGDDDENIKRQLKIVESSLNNDEINFLTTEFPNDENPLYNLIRIETNDGINHAIIEGDTLDHFASILNGTTTDGGRTDKAIYLSSIFKKISLGTIH